jgi:hypothetical protein
VTLLGCIPVCTTLTALGLLFLVVLLIGAYNRSPEPEAPAAPAEPKGFPWMLAIAVVITIVIPTLMLLAIWFLPEW